MANKTCIPKPYTPVTASVSEFKCLGSESGLGVMLLPDQIMAADQPLLSAPIRLAASPDSLLEGITGQGQVIENTGDAVRLEWQGDNANFKIRATMTGECDGFCWYKITLIPKQPIEVSSLRLEIPRLPNTASLTHAACFAWSGQTSGGIEEVIGSKGAFVPYVWLGDEERGLAWCCESQEGWDLNDPDSAREIRSDSDTVLFITNLIDHPKLVDTPITLQFGLQATPVKPVSFDWRAKARIYHGVTYSSYEPNAEGKILLDALKDGGVKTVVFHQDWPGYYGKLTPDGDLHRLIDECHKRDLKLLLYIGYGVARRGPDIGDNHDTWSVVPLIPWDLPTLPFADNYGFDATCARSGWADWLVDGIDDLFTDYKLDGLYFDGTSEAWQCENESHGCGWRDEQGKIHQTYPMLAVRAMMRRIADTVHKHCKDAILDVHMSASLTMPTLSFCDSYWDGEQYELYTTADKVEIPLDTFRAEFMGYAHGLDAQFLCYQGRPWVNVQEAIALAGLHGVEVRPMSIKDLTSCIAPMWQAFDRFDYTHAKWIPYWKDTGVTSSNESVKTSVYLKKDSALLFVSHLKRQQVTASIKLDRAKLVPGPGSLSARDAISGIPLQMADNEITLKFDGMSYLLVEILCDG